MILCGLFVLQACATGNRVAPPPESPVNSPSKDGVGLVFNTPDSTKDQSKSKGTEAYGPPVPPEQYGPEPPQSRPLVLVLGPGLARGFAYVGVLRALKDAHIPIGAIYGTEMGGLVGTLYSMSRTLNQFEWGLLKFKENVFVEKKGLLSQLVPHESNGDKLEAQLKQVFNKKDLADGIIPVRISLFSQDRGSSFVVSQGSAVAALRGALAVPGMMSPGPWTTPAGTEKVFSAGTRRPFLVDEAKSAGVGPVLVIDVLTDAEAAVAFDELKGADLVIKPDVSGIGNLDFQKRTEAAFRGKRAILQHLTDIRRLVGLP